MASSELSWQSLSPSQMKAGLVQIPVEHWNCPGLHLNSAVGRGGRGETSALGNASRANLNLPPSGSSARAQQSEPCWLQRGSGRLPTSMGQQPRLGRPSPALSCNGVTPPSSAALSPGQSSRAFGALTAVLGLIGTVPAVVLCVAFPPERDAFVVLADKLQQTENKSMRAAPKGTPDAKGRPQGTPPPCKGL